MYEPVEYTFEEHKKRIFAIPGVQAEYDALEEEYAILEEMVRARRRARKTQQDVAKAMNTSASAISRIESLNSTHSPSLNTLRKYAKAIGCQLRIKFIAL